MKIQICPLRLGLVYSLNVACTAIILWVFYVLKHMHYLFDSYENILGKPTKNFLPNKRQGTKREMKGWVIRVIQTHILVTMK